MGKTKEKADKEKGFVEQYVLFISKRDSEYKELCFLLKMQKNQRILNFLYSQEILFRVLEFLYLNQITSF